MINKRSKLHIYSNLYPAVLTLLLVLISFSACSDSDDAPLYPDTAYITVSPFIETGTTRIQGNSFEENDAIGVYVVEYAEDNITPGVISTDSYAANAQHIYNESSWLLPSGGKLSWPSTGRHVDLYSYYPYDQSLDNANPTGYTFTVEPDQSTHENYERSDFLWSKTENVVPTSQPVQLVFSHQLAKIRVNVRSEIEAVQQELADAAVTIQNIIPSGVVNLGNGSVSPNAAASRSNVVTRKNNTASLGYQLTTEGIIMPQDGTQGQQLIQIDLLTSGTRYHFIPDENIPFLQGTERNLNITITSQGLSVSVGDIAPWQPSQVIEGEIGDPVPRVLDITNINWDDSRIHQVYDERGIWIAGICREYLFGTGVNAQAIVAYGVNAEGALDISNGFVAQVMSYEASTFTYYPSVSNIHGGYVNWGSNNSITSYVQGTNPVIEKIEFRADGTIAAAPQNYITTLESSPYQMIDVDGNRYPVVKISNQYWSAENLKVEHFRDGSDLTYYYYLGNPDNKELFGGLYTWATATDERGLCPENWTVPANTDFTALTSYLVVAQAGRKLKANTLWINLNYNDNITGFSGLPAGRRTNAGAYSEAYYYGQWWSTTPYSNNWAYRLYLDFGNNATHNTYLSRQYTQSIRCIRM